jgi:hypothetical protein
MGPNQPLQLDIAWSIDHILHDHADINFRVSGFKHEDTQGAYCNTKKLALAAVRGPIHPDNTITTNYLRQQVKSDATKKWEEQWHASPRTSLAYRTACTQPPNGRPHPILIAHQEGWRTPDAAHDAEGQAPKAKPSRATTSTMFRMITGHAFTGEYTARFRGNKLPQPLPEEAVACPCGELPQTAEHVLIDCPLYEDARRKHLSTRGRVWSLDQLFDLPLHCTGTMRFLEETQACAKPRAVDWDPG